MYIYVYCMIYIIYLINKLVLLFNNLKNNYFRLNFINIDLMLIVYIILEENLKYNMLHMASPCNKFIFHFRISK